MRRAARILIFSPSAVFAVPGALSATKKLLEVTKRGSVKRKQEEREGREGGVGVDSLRANVRGCVFHEP